MTPSDLQALFTRLSAGAQTIVLDPHTEQLPMAGELPAFLLMDRITITGCTVAPDATTDARVTGTATLGGMPDTRVTLIGGGDAAHTWLRLVTDPLPAAFRLPTVLGILPDAWTVPPRSDGLQPVTSPIAGLALTGATITLATAADDADGLARGINVYGQCKLDAALMGGVAGALLGHVQGDQLLDVTGTATLQRGLPAALDLRAQVPGLRFTIGGSGIESVYLWLYTATPVDTGIAESRVELAGSIRIGSVPVTVSTTLLAGASSWVFRGIVEDDSASLANALGAVAALFGGDAADLKLPDALADATSLALQQASFAIDSRTAAVEYLNVVLGFPADRSWDLGIDGLTLGDLTAGFTVVLQPTRRIQGYVAGTVAIGSPPVSVDVSAALPGFTVLARMEAPGMADDGGDDDDAPPAPAGLSLSDLVHHFLPDTPQVPDIALTQFNFAAQPGTGTLFLGATVQSDWTFQLGSIRDFGIQRVSLVLERSAASGFSGQIGGSATLAGAEFDASYGFPGGGFVIGADIPSVRLGDLIDALADTKLTLPDALNPTFTGSRIAIVEQNGEFTFMLATTVEHWGYVFFQLMRSSASGWGVAVGADLTGVQKLGDVPGFEFMNAIDLTLDELALVLSSADLPSGYTFPTMPGYDATGGAAGRIAIPAGIGTPKQGINVYAQFAFGDPSATGSKPLVQVAQYFGISRVVLDVALQASYRDGGVTALLLAGATAQGYGLSGASRHNFTISAYLAIEYTGSDVDLFLRGVLTLGVPDDSLTFAMELGIEENGCYVAGNMTGAWQRPFGIAGLTVSDLALEIGADWEGIPTVGFAGELTAGSFDGSLAVLVNSADPNASVLAGALSDITLGDVVASLAGQAADDRDAAALIDVLKHISIRGTEPVTLPAAAAVALDARDGAGVAAAFSGAGIALSAGAADTLVVVATKGSRWFVTDRRAPVHYEVSATNGAITVEREAQLYVAPAATRIGTANYPQGFRLSGTLDLFGFVEQTNIEIAASKGFVAEEWMSPISIFNGALKVTQGTTVTPPAGAGSGGPFLSIATYSRPSQKGVLAGPHALISGAVDLLGLEGMELDLLLTTAGVRVLVSETVAAVHYGLDFCFTTSPLAVSGGGTVSLDIDLNVDLSHWHLGTLRIADVECAADVALSLNGQDLNAAADAKFSATVPVFGVKVGPYSVKATIDVAHPFTELKSVVESGATELDQLAADIAKVLLTDARRFAQLAKEGLVTLESSLDSTLQSVFGVSLADLDASAGTCFAGDRLVPRMMATRGATLQAAVAVPAQEDQLAMLRGMRADLAKSDMGRWILGIYNRLSEPLVRLYDSDATFRKAIDVYHGQDVYASLIATLHDSTSGGGIRFSSEDLNNGMNIVRGVIRLSSDQTVQAGVSALLGQLNTFETLLTQAESYDDALARLASIKAPPDPFATKE